MKDIKFILVLLLGLLLASAASPAASVEQLKGWLAANGLDPVVGRGQARRRRSCGRRASFAVRR